MVLSCSDNRLFAGIRSDRPARALLLVTCLGVSRWPRVAAQAAAPLGPGLNGAFAALLMFFYRNGAM